jgi:hypothetical protein
MGYPCRICFPCIDQASSHVNAGSLPSHPERAEDRELDRLRAIEAAAKTWMEWGGHCPTCAFVRHREGNPLLSIELLWDYCDCGWHAARAALAAKEML